MFALPTRHHIQLPLLKYLIYIFTHTLYIISYQLRPTTLSKTPQHPFHWRTSKIKRATEYTLEANKDLNLKHNMYEQLSGWRLKKIQYRVFWIYVSKYNIAYSPPFSAKSRMYDWEKIIKTEAKDPKAKDTILERTRSPLKISLSNNVSKFCHVPFQTATKIMVTRNWQKAKS